MTHEIEAIVLDALPGSRRLSRGHALPSGAPCPNCQTTLQGRWCHGCGQRAEEFHRSIWHLVAEAFEGLTHFDGRFWQTVPKLIYRPGQLTRAYLDGHRASQIPPFRLFLIVLLLVFFTGGLSFSAHPNKVNIRPAAHPGLNASLSASDKADVKEAMDEVEKLKTTPGGGYWQERAEHAMQNRQAVFHAMEQWGHRLAVLMLPIAALMLSVLFAFKRGVYVFDHLIFSMHSLSFQGLLLTTIFLGSLLSGAFWWLLWIAPVHLFVHMRGTYKSSVFGTLLRMWVLFIGSAIAVVMLLIGLLIIGVVSAH